MKDDPMRSWRRSLKVLVRAALGLVVLGLMVAPVVIQADLKNVAAVYAWDFVAAKFQNSNVLIPWNGTWIPIFQELYFDTDVWADPSVCGYDPSIPDTGTPWAGDVYIGLYHTDLEDVPPGAPGFQESQNWSLISCDRDQDGRFTTADLLAPPLPYDRGLVYAECTPTGDHCRLEESEQDAVTECVNTGNCLYEIVTRLQVNLDLDCDGAVDQDLIDEGLIVDPRIGEPQMLCFYEEARTPTPAEQAGLVWRGPLQARITYPLGVDHTVNFALVLDGLLPSAAFSAAPLSGTVPLTVTFGDESSGPNNTWFWDFGDGGSSTEPNPTHVYDEAGSWDVTLTVLGPNGTDLELKPDYIETAVFAPVISGQRVSNVRDTSLTMSWITDLDSDGYVEYGTTTALGQTAEDVRGGGHTGFTHYVQVGGLQPGITYYFDILSGSTRDDNGGAHYTVTTGPTLAPPGSDIAHGLVYQDDAVTPVEGAIVLITVTERDGSGDSGSAALLSCLTNETGGWTTDLGYARLPDLSSYFQYSPSADTLFLEANGGPLGDTCLYEDTGSDSPSADLVLGDPCVIQVSIEGLLATSDSPTPLGNLTTLTASVSSGSSISYSWDFGDGELGSGEVASHSYPATGVYTAAVTASNPVSSLTATTPITITERTFCDDVSEIPRNECQALVALYNSTDGPHWLTNAGWLDTNTPCSWYGVTCGSDNVLELSLGSNELSGTIPLDLGGLTNLGLLDLSGNHLRGSIPSEIDGLAYLGSLRLESNALEGEIPASITTIWGLTTADLGYNMLTATDPALLTFLKEKDPDWADTQTVPPADLQVTGVTPNSVQLSWTPISYTGDDGYYEISYATTPGGPDAIHVPTSDKTASGYLVEGLETEADYYFVLRTYTPAHDYQQNELWSSYSEEVSATPRAVCQARVNDAATVYNDVQSAVDAAGEGDLVKVAGYCAGVQSRAGITQTVYISKTITLQGGYTTTNWILPDPESNPTTLDALGQGRVLYITGTISPTVEGLRITGGDAYDGGGIYVDQASATISNSLVYGNHAAHDGGGMYNSSSSPMLTNMAFEANSAPFHGGGMFNSASSPLLINCTFMDNSAGQGGGMFNLDSSSPAVTNSTFSDNSASSEGGGMFNSASSPTLTDVSFEGNLAGRGGGGGIFNFADSYPLLTNCAFRGNSTGGRGGGMYNYVNCAPVLINCTFSGNSAGEGGGMYNDTSSPTLTNCTFWGNSAGAGGGIFSYGSSPVLTNCVLWADFPSEIFNDTFLDLSVVISYSDVQGGCDGIPGNDCGAGNIDADPLFIDPGNGDFHLGPGSPCVDVGTNDAPNLPLFDFEGDDRIIDGHGDGMATVDMGVDEAREGIPRPPMVIFVDQDAVGAHDGTSWADAITDLQEALAMANAGDRIWVAEGIYKPTSGTDRSASFQMKNGVAIYGGFAGTESELEQRDWTTRATVLSGDLNGDDRPDSANNDENSYHVFYHPEGESLDGTAILDGFTISGGNANGAAPHDSGGGMYNFSVSPTLSNCTFAGNMAIELGGGLFNYEGSAPALTNCTFAGNRADHAGGGISNFEGSSPTLSDCAFWDNWAGQGGGMHNGYASPTLINCTFSGNSSGDPFGGGMINYFSSPVLTNCTFTGNLAGNEGGAIGNFWSSPTLTNCILWGNSPDQISNYDSSPVVTHSDVQGGHPGVDNLDADPLFVDPANGDFHLGPGSPCIDAGDNTAPDLSPYDFEGDSRILDGDSDGTPIVDMGVDEVPGGTNPPGVIFVDQDATGTNDGTSWADAFTELQPALGAVVAGEQIWVAEGTYLPSQEFTPGDPRSAAFQMKNAVAIYGGFDPSVGDTAFADRDWVLNKTILSGDLNGDDGPDFANNDENSHHVFYHPDGMGLDSSAILDGVIITGGNASGSHGGGMYNGDSSPTLTNITFKANSAEGWGGGMHNWRSSPTLTDVTFEANAAEDWGGGMHTYGGSPVLVNCLFRNNSAGEWGGGVANDSSSPVLTNCTFSGNWAGSEGGGMANFSPFSPVSAVLTNCVLWADFPDEILSKDGASTVISHSDVQGGCETIPGSDCGAGNIDADPFFTDPANGDFHLAPGSPCIDAGTNDAPDLPVYDFEGDERIMDGDGDGTPIVDMGVDEAAYVPTGTFCDGVSEIPKAECQALVAFHNSTGGRHWSNNTGWLVANTPCTDWYGVECSAGHVIDLSLPNNQLSGLLPPEIGDLASLNSLDLSSNELGGEIPPELGRLTGLETLRLGANQLSGELPPELGDLVNLEDLWLYSNRLSGTIPSTLEDLAALQVLRLDANQLSGIIPADLAKLSGLYWLDLGYNMLIAQEPELLAFLSEHDPDWAETQTVPPAGLGATAVTSSTVELSWTPIPYTSDGGYYEISYSTVHGGPYIVHDITPDKEASAYTVDGLLPDMQYYFVVRTYTPSHLNQQNELWSWYSEEASAATPAVLCDPVSTVQLSRIPAGDLYEGTTVYVSAIAEGTAPLTYTWTLDGLPVNGDRSTYDHTFESAGAYTVGVTVSNACGGNAASLVITVEESIPELPDLSLSQKTASLTSVETGDLLTYTLLLRNVSSVEATVDLIDAIPQYTTYFTGSGQASDAGPVTLQGDELLWAGQVISGTPVVIEFAVEVESPPLGAQIVNTAYLEADSEDAGVLEATSTFNPGYRLTINDGDRFTKVPTVTLGYAWNVDDAITHVKFSNDGAFVPGENTSDWLPVDPVNSILDNWVLDTYGDLRMSRTVYARFRDSLGNQFGPFQDDIVFDPDLPAVTSVEILEPVADDPRALAESEVIVRVISSDTNTGVSVIQIAENSSFDGYLEFPVLGPVTDIPWVLQGSSLLYVRVVDRAGNLSEAASAPTGIPFKVYMPVLLRNAP